MDGPAPSVATPHMQPPSHANPSVAAHGHEIWRGTDTSIVLVLMVVALASRWPGMTLPLWFDETLTSAWVRTPTWGEMFARIDHFENLPAGYFVLMRLWALAFGAGELSLRLPSMIASVLTVPAVVALVWQMTRSRRAALVGGLAIAAMPYQFGFAIDARPYAMFLLLQALQTLLLLRWADRASRGRAIGYTLLGAASLWLHPFALLTMTAHGAWVLLRHRARLRPYLILSGAAVVLFAPALSRMLQTTSTGVTWMHRISPLDAYREFAATIPFAIVLAVAVGSVLLSGVRRRDRVAVALACAAWLAAEAFGASLGVRTWLALGATLVAAAAHRRSAALLPLLLVTLTVMLPLVLSDDRRALLHPRYAIVASVGLVAMIGTLATRGRTTAGCLAVALVVASASERPAERVTRIDIRAAMGDLRPRLTPGEVVAVSGGAYGMRFLVDHELRHAGVRVVDLDADTKADWVVRFDDEHRVTIESARAK